MKNSYELRLLMMVVHCASQHAYYWLHPDKLRAACAFMHSQPGGDAMSRLSLQDWRAVVAMVAALFKEMLPSSPLRRVLRQTDMLAGLLYRHLQCCVRHGAEVVVYGDPLYPVQLQTIPDPPLALTLHGNTDLLARPTVAIVGARKASPRGLRESFALGQIMAQRGWVVVSGGAYGCDIAAHRGVLATAVRPRLAIAVFAGGLATLHPRGNQTVFDSLLQQGALFISERLWHAPCRPCDFPVRNRIIAGLASTLMVMEAGERSGATLTAALSLSQGAEVWVLQHPVSEVRAAGSQRLIMEGAHSFPAAAVWATEASK